MKSNFRYLLYICLSSIFFLVSCAQKDIIIKNLKCEHLDNPIAIDNAEPLLSWQLQSIERNKKQSAYRILVASDPSLLKDSVADLWDSGIVKSDQSVNVPYKGKRLGSRQNACWKVMVWDENNQPSDWSKTSFWSMGLLNPEDWAAQWITNMEDMYPDSTLTYPAPYFRKEVEINKSIKKAKAYICGLGFYELYLNGEKVGDHVMAPVVTNYDKRQLKNLIYPYDDQSTQRVLYNTFDVTDMLKKGKNALGAILGNGWYNQRERTVEGWMWYNTPRMILQLEIEYKDGSTEVIKTDETWKTSDSPIIHNSIFIGEVYDARLEQDGWNKVNYDDSTWKDCIIAKSPVGSLQPQLAPADKVIRSLDVKLKEQVNDSTYIYELPELISGWIEINVKGSAGDYVKMQFFGEEGDSFGQQDIYISKGGDAEKWEPRFTWHAFRTFKVISPNIKLEEKDLIAKVVHTSVERSGEFNCSNDLFNKIFDAYIRTQNANFHGSISSDCPHRERLAYTGDGQALTESSILSYDMTRMYPKWFNDMEDARNKKTGYVPHTAPFAGGGGGPAWGSAFVIMPWIYYNYYGNKAILKSYYEGMKQWVEYLGTRTNERGLIVKEEPNGWCLGDWCMPDDSNHTPLPEPLANTCYYYHMSDIMSKIAGILGMQNDSLFFADLASKIKQDFNREFYNPETNHYWEGRQGADVFPLAFGLVPEDNKEKVFNALLKHLENIDYHFDTGFLATPLTLKVLSDNGRDDIAFRLMNQNSYPSYAYLMDDKYSTIWERWDGRDSRCHPMFGGVVTWFYRAIAGINIDESNPVMKHIKISPKLIGDIKYCNASYKSLYGMIRSSWKIQEGGTININIEIPVNTAATVYLPEAKNKTVTESGLFLDQHKDIHFVGFDNNDAVIELGSGKYEFIISAN
ncbi:family 78 glycoside hydrolase catalytic domain [Prevotella sp. 10(H)]|uniref:family 78 glycoside hydrolase catalytic domain n=1 Tax=Prevotella sp. 10(H) TaxID=1158294 RepID=UPI0009DEF7BD|nr:family 78 glycoside hydrolase catalytic domain [Prevotella sp. 10(H)]